MVFRRPLFGSKLHVFYLLLLGVLFAAPLVTSSVAFDTCNGVTLKCYTPKTAIAGGKTRARLTLSTEGKGRYIDEIGIDWNGTQLFYTEYKLSAFKAATPTISDTKASWYGPAWQKLHSNTTKKVKFGATFNVDPCALFEQYISVYASAGACSLQVHCHPVRTSMVKNDVFASRMNSLPRPIQGWGSAQKY